MDVRPTGTLPKLKLFAFGDRNPRIPDGPPPGVAYPEQLERATVAIIGRKIARKAKAPLERVPLVSTGWDRVRKRMAYIV